MNYGISKMKAKEFAKEGRAAYICKAKGDNHCYIIFKKEDLTPKHTIIEKVTPEN